MRNFVMTIENLKELSSDMLEKTDTVTILYKSGQSLPINMISVFTGIKAKLNLMEMPNEDSESNARINFMAGFLYAQSLAKNDNLCFIGDQFKLLSESRIQDENGRAVILNCYSTLAEALKKMKTGNTKSAPAAPKKPRARRKIVEKAEEEPAQEEKVNSIMNPPQADDYAGSSLANKMKEFRNILADGVHDKKVLHIIESKESMIFQAVAAAGNISILEMQLKFNLGSDDAAAIYPVFSPERYEKLKNIAQK